MTAPTPGPCPSADDSDPGNRPAVRRLMLSHFRNYRALRLVLDDLPVVLTGANGSGKTNILEALSFLAPGRGLRRARLVDINTAGAAATVNWAVSAEIHDAAGSVVIGTGHDPDAAATGRERRLVQIDGVPATSQSALSDRLAISWLTPQMDRLFADGSGGRRRFLDRLIHAFDPLHAGRVNRYARILRERVRLFRDGRTDGAWHSALEDQLAAAGVAIAAARRDLIARLAPRAATGSGPFPGAALALAGDLEAWLEDAPALSVEDRFRTVLAAGRRRTPGDAMATPGPHRSDLIVRHAAKAMPALHCSTGEQKALLIAILLAHARLRRADFGAAPLMLLDEVAAHLDAERRSALCRTLATLGSQAWLTGTDAALFAPFADRAQYFVVNDGTLLRQSRRNPL